MTDQEPARGDRGLLRHVRAHRSRNRAHPRRPWRKAASATQTLVIFMSDHGELLGDHHLYFKGPHFYEGAIRVPLIVRYPDGGYAAGSEIEDLVELTDLAPTLLEAAGYRSATRPPAGPQPRARADRQGVGTPRQQIFCEYYNSWTHGEAYASCVRTRVRRKSSSITAPDEGELYDLTRPTPNEFVNLWNDPAAAVIENWRSCSEASTPAYSRWIPARPAKARFEHSATTTSSRSVAAFVRRWTSGRAARPPERQPLTEPRPHGRRYANSLSTLCPNTSVRRKSRPW